MRIVLLSRLFAWMEFPTLQAIMCVVMIKLGKFVAFKPPLAFFANPNRRVTTADAPQDLREALANLRHGDRRRPFFSPAASRTTRTRPQLGKA